MSRFKRRFGDYSRTSKREDGEYQSNAATREPNRKKTKQNFKKLVHCAKINLNSSLSRLARMHRYMSGFYGIWHRHTPLPLLNNNLNSSLSRLARLAAIFILAKTEVFSAQLEVVPFLHLTHSNLTV